MASEFGVSTQMVANSLPAYFFRFGMGQLIYGPLVSNRIGRKPPLYFGLALFSLASMLCVFAQNEWGLIAARILQALGGCVGVVIARAAIRDRLDLQTSAQAFSSMMIVMTIAPVDYCTYAGCMGLPMDELASCFCSADLRWNYLLFMCALLF